jgi:hypothetical protein
LNLICIIAPPHPPLEKERTAEQGLQRPPTHGYHPTILPDAGKKLNHFAQNRVF